MLRNRHAQVSFEIPWSEQREKKCCTPEKGMRLWGAKSFLRELRLKIYKVHQSRYQVKWGKKVVMAKRDKLKVQIQYLSEQICE